MESQAINSSGSKKKKKLSSKLASDYIWAYILILPTVLGIGIFYVGAFFQNIFYSFTDLGAFGKWSFVGFTNYNRLFHDKQVLDSLYITFKYTFLSVPLTIIVAIVIAVLLNSKIKGIGIYRTLYFLPAVTMPAAVAMVWKWLYNGNFGLINILLAKIGIDGPAWIANPKIVMFALVIVAVWMSTGFNMVILLAGLQGISNTYYEAASLDGAGPIYQFFNITLPLLSPTIFFVSVMALINAFQMFDLVFLMLDKSSLAGSSTRTVVYLFYKYAFEWYEKGYAATIAVIIFIIIMFVTVIQLQLQKKWVHYD